MVEVLDLILEFFRVQDYANKYSTPTDQFLYSIFFPSVLLVAIIFLLSKAVFSGHRGIQILIGISIYIFMIVYPPGATYSLYSIFVPFTILWFLVVILLGGFYYIFFMHRGGGGGGGGGGRAPVPLSSRMGDAHNAYKLYKRVGAEEPLREADFFIREKRRLEGKSPDPKTDENIIQLTENALRFFEKYENDPIIWRKLKPKREEFLKK